MAHRFTVETYDQSSGSEEEMSFTDIDIAAAEFKRLSEAMGPAFSVVLRREDVS